MTREEAIDRIRDMISPMPSAEKDNIEALEMAVEALKAVPVKHGEWVASRVGGSSSWFVECSKCRVVMPPVNYTYCPNCGAKMDGEKE